eukprot:NODE_109_length_18665_cov_0.924486.p4 type:complete len:449 gc:universal NODE_109_length_18665_cov_0.924486:9748-11094(+)
MNKLCANCLLMSQTSNLRIILISIIFFGISLVWSLELSFGTPFLLALGWTKSSTSFIWLAGPLSGLLAQPLVGSYSDQHTTRFGRRRPLMVISTIIILFSMLMIYQETTIMVALGFYFLDFSVNSLQAISRAFVLDVVESVDHAKITAWSSIMGGVGTICGNFMGYMRDYGSSKDAPIRRMKDLLFISSFILIITTTISCVIGQEIVRYRYVPKGLGALVRKLMRGIFNLPKEMQNLCAVQFFTWMGFFPFLFYSSTWIAEYAAYSKRPFDTEYSEYAAEMGSYGTLWFSNVAFASSFLLPLISKWIDKRHLYTMCLYLFCCLLASTIVVTGAKQAIAITAAAGITWAAMAWLPFVIVAEFISKNQELVTVERSTLDSGSLLGILNVFVVLPQFVMLIISTVMFSIFEGIDGPFGLWTDAIGWILRIGCIFLIFATYISQSLWIKYER